MLFSETRDPNWMGMSSSDGNVVLYHDGVLRPSVTIPFEGRVNYIHRGLQRSGTAATTFMENFLA